MLTRGTRLEGRAFRSLMGHATYGLNDRGQWEVCTPNGRRGSLDPADHTVTEHEDGTISVEPSLLIEPLTRASSGVVRPGWHGYLRFGTFQEL